MTTTKFENMINPEVMGQMISSIVDKKVRFIPYAKVDNSLSGRPGDTLTIPYFSYVGDAFEVSEAQDIESKQLSTFEKRYTIKKIGNRITLTDEAIMNGYGDIIGETSSQLGTSVSQKIDQDCIDTLYTAELYSDQADSELSYLGVINTIDVFDEEFNSNKVLFIHPKQMSTLRSSDDFISADKYNERVMQSGEIGMIANTHIVVSKRVKELDSYYVVDEASGTAVTTSNLAEVQESLPNAKVGDKVTKVSKKIFLNPMVKLSNDPETEYATAPLTIFMKKGVMLETDRNIVNQTNEFVVSEHYGVALTDASKVIIARFKRK